MKLRFTTHAVQDLTELADHIRARNPVAAQRVRAAIYETLRNLILFPKVGRRQTTEGVRKVVSTHTSSITLWMMQPMRSSSSTSSTLRASATIAMSDP